jgi:TolA-binding protein
MAAGVRLSLWFHNEEMDVWEPGIEPFGITMIFAAGMLPLLSNPDPGALLKIIPFLATVAVTSLKLTPPLQDSFRAITSLRAGLPDLEETLTRLNGANESLTYELQQARKALAASDAANRSLGDRLAALEGRATQIEAAVASQQPVASEEDSAQEAAGDPDGDFAKARKFMLDGDYDSAEAAFQTFVKRYGDTEKGPEARYWLGKTLSVRGANADAAGAFIGAIRGWPKTAWAPDATLEGCPRAHFERLERGLVALDERAPQRRCERGGLAVARRGGLDGRSRHAPIGDKRARTATDDQDARRARDRRRAGVGLFPAVRLGVRGHPPSVAARGVDYHPAP